MADFKMLHTKKENNNNDVTRQLKDLLYYCRWCGNGDEV